MHRETKATAIPSSVKQAVYERDSGVCIFCKRNNGIPNSHIIRRSRGGRGVVENIITACPSCHKEFDEGKRSVEMMEYAISYIKGFYPDWTAEKVTYKKYGGK